MKGSIYKRPNGIFYYEWSAMKIKKSLKTKSKEEAEEIVLKNYSHLWFRDKTEAFRIGLEKLEKSQDEELALLQSTESHKSILLDNIMEEYLKALKISSKGSKRHKDAETTLAPRTIKDITSRLLKLNDFIKLEFPNVEKMNQVSPLMARQFFKVQNFKLATHNRYLSDYMTIFEKLKVEGGIKENPFSSIDLMSKSEVEQLAATKEPFSLEELELISTKATGWLKLAFLFGFFTPLRLGDVIALRWDEINLKEGFVELETRKSSKHSLLYIPEIIPEIIKWKENCKDEEYLFGVQARGMLRRNDSSYQCRQIANFFKGIGIKTKDEQGRTIKGFHSFRKSYATYQHIMGKSKDYIQSQLAHSSQATTEGYIMLTEEAKKEKLRLEHIPISLDGTINNDELILEQIKRLADQLTDKAIALKIAEATRAT